MPHAARSQKRLQLLSCCLLDLQDLGNVLSHLHVAALWLIKAQQNLGLCCEGQCKGIMWVWIRVLGRTPTVLAVIVIFLFCMTPAEGGVLKSGTTGLLWHKPLMILTATPSNRSMLCMCHSLPHPTQLSTWQTALTYMFLFTPSQGPCD